MIPILLDKRKNLDDLVDSKTGGLGDISGAYEGKAIEEANGLKEISFKLPIDSPRYNDLKVGSYIKVKADDLHDLQIYEVYKITRPMNGIVTVKAQHISYILGKASVLPFTATGIIPVINAMQSNIVGQYPFTMETDIVNPTNTFTLATPMSFRGAIGGWKGSILDVFGGELDWDNLKVKLLAHRGVDNGVKIEYGKNLTNLTQEESIANVYDAVIGFAVVDDVTYVGDIQKIIQTNSPRTLNVDFSSEFDTEHLPTTQRLNELAMSYAINNDIGKPSVNLKISFELLSKTTEYKDIAILERTGLFDTVYVSFPKLGVESKAKVIKTEYDFINEKPISVELGDAKTNLTNLIDEQINQNNLSLSNDISSAKKAISVIDQAIEEMSSVITNSLGLFYTRVVRAGGGYQYYLHNKPTLQDSQYQWTINAGGLALSQDYGVTWAAGIDSDGNAVFNSLSANIVNAMKIYGSYIQGSQIVFGDVTDKYITAQPYSNGITFDGTGTIRMQPQEAFYLNNCTADGSKYYNRLVMNKNANTTNTNNAIFLYNYDDTQNYINANFIQLDAHYTYKGATYNRTVWHNYATHTGTSVSANLIMMEARDGASYMYLNNRKQSETNLANQVQFSYSSAQNNLYLRNYNQAADSIGNVIQLNATNTSNALTLTNNKTGTTNIANRVNLEASATFNRAGITNYFLSDNKQANSLTLDVLSGYRAINLLQYDNDYISNNISLYVSATQRNISIEQNSINTEKSINGLLLSYNLTNESSSVSLTNGRYDISSTSYNSINSIAMSASSSTNDIYIRNENNSGVLKNKIEMKAGTTNSILIRNNATTASRYNELEMSDGGNFNLYSSDDMNLKAMDICRVQGVNTLVLASSDVQLWIGNTQVSLYLSGGYVRYS